MRHPSKKRREPYEKWEHDGDAETKLQLALPPPPPTCKKNWPALKKKITSNLPSFLWIEYSLLYEVVTFNF